MKQQFDDLFVKIEPFISFIRRYLTFSVVILFLVIYAFITFRINTLSNRQPSDGDVTIALKAVPRPKVDPTTLKKIQQLQDQNVQVQSLFNQARNNPFSE